MPAVRVSLRPNEPALRWLIALWAALATHGSLYPWQFTPPASLAAQWAHMVHQPSWWTSTGDVLGNVLLFIPLGVLGWWVCKDHPARSRSLAGLVAGAAAFAFLLQVVQLFEPMRDAQLSDVVWTLCCLAIGLVLGRRWPVPELSRLSDRRLMLAMSMALLWLALQWWPLSPILSRGQVAYAFRPLLESPQWTALTVLQAALSLGVLGVLCRDLRLRSTVILACAGAAVVGKLLTAGQALSLSHAIGWLIGVGLSLLAWRLPMCWVAGLGAMVSWLYFGVKALRMLVSHHSVHCGNENISRGVRLWCDWTARVARTAAPADSLALGWTLYWLLAALILSGIAWRVGGITLAKGSTQPPRWVP